MAADPPFLLLAALGGLLVGTLADPFVDQFYSDPLLYSPFGKCRRCNTHLLPFGAIALVGYVRWRGRCPHCSTPFPLRSVLLPTAMAVLFVLTLAGHDDGREIALTMTFGAFALLLATTDAERHIAPNRIMYPALALAVVLAPFWPQHSLLNLYLTGAGLLALFLALRLALGIRVGLGDIKFAALLGLTLGMPDAAIALGVAAIAALGAVIVVFAEAGPPTRLLPFGSMLAIGMIFTLLWAGHVT